MSDLFNMIHNSDKVEKGIIFQVRIDGVLIEFPEPDETFPPESSTGESIEVVIEDEQVGAMLESQEAKDYVLLSRLLKFELTPLLHEWHAALQKPLQLAH